MPDPIFVGTVTNPFNLANVTRRSKPTFVDIDGDGDLDAFIGNYDGNTLFFRNMGTIANPLFATGTAVLTNHFGLIDVGEASSPTFVDIDGDGDLDAFIGNYDGNTLFFRNMGTIANPIFATGAAVLTNPFSLIAVGRISKPTFVDIDGDGYLDAFIGNRAGNTLFFKNTGTGTITNPIFATGAAVQTNYFGLINVGLVSSPTFVDIDGDGDLDAFIGNDDGNTLFFRNTGTITNPIFATGAAVLTNPFGLVDVGFSSTPALVDINGDGDLDAFVGNYDGNTLLYRNALRPVRNDFDGNGKSDILWRNDNGSIARWNMNGATVVSSNLTSTATLPISWKTAGTGDFDGDGKSDILWRNDDGRIVVWKMNGDSVVSATLTSPSTLPISWKTAGTGDFDGDGKSDILWRNDDGRVVVWKMNGDSVVSATLTSTPTLPSSWKTAGTGDFNGDGKSDILWRNDNGSIALWQMDGFNVASSSLTSIPSLDNSWKINGTGDFDGNGKSDILWRNDDGRVVLWRMSGATVDIIGSTSVPSVDNSWKITGTGDFNGDGKSDILWRNNSGVTSVWTMSGTNVGSSTLTSALAVDPTWKIAAPLL